MMFEIEIVTKGEFGDVSLTLADVPDDKLFDMLEDMSVYADNLKHFVVTPELEEAE